MNLTERRHRAAIDAATALADAIAANATLDPRAMQSAAVRFGWALLRYDLITRFEALTVRRAQLG